MPYEVGLNLGSKENKTFLKFWQLTFAVFVLICGQNLSRHKKPIQAFEFFLQNEFVHPFSIQKNNANHATLFSLLHLIPTRKKQKYSQTFSFDSTSFEEAYLHYYNFLPTNALRIRLRLK